MWLTKAVALPAVPLLLGACEGPLSTLSPAGPAAREIAGLWWAMLGGAAALTLLVGVLLALAFGRPRAVRAGVWTHGLGLGLSAAVLGPLLAAGLWVGERILPRPDGAPEVGVHAEQWRWRVTHPGPEGPVVLHDRLILPARQPVDLRLTSADVIHSFWVPRLGGKMDAIPGHVNLLRIEADAPGRHAGQCAEFCGLGHAVMRFEVEVVPAADWPDALRAAARGEAAPGDASEGDDPAGDDPAGDDPAGDLPTGDTPTVEAPTGDTPTGEAPAGEAPVGDVPARDAPAGDAPVSDAGPQAPARRRADD